MLGPVAPEHGWVPSPRYLLRRARILALTRNLPPGDLLEVGCGAGMLLHEFARRGFRCVALETSSPALDLARHLAAVSGLPIDLRQASDPAWEGRFDAVFAFEVLEHTADDRATLASWKGWLRAGGRLLMSVPAHERRWSAQDEWAGHYRRYERTDLVHLLSEEGFVVERLECYGYPLANLTEAVGARYHARAARVGGSGGSDADRRAATDRSGIDRGPHVRLHPLLKSPPGRLLLACSLGVQRLFLGTELGSGYVLRAHRR
jgi:SAM-dependent methyltransferase